MLADIEKVVHMKNVDVADGLDISLNFVSEPRIKTQEELLDDRRDKLLKANYCERMQSVDGPAKKVLQRDIGRDNYYKERSAA